MSASSSSSVGYDVIVFISILRPHITSDINYCLMYNFMLPFETQNGSMIFLFLDNFVIDFEQYRF